MKKQKKHNNETSFMGRVILFFRSIKEKISSMQIFKKFSDKRKAIAGYEEGKASNDARLAYGFDLSRIISLILLIILLLFTLVFAGSRISYEDIYYMFKDIGYVSSFGERPPEVLNYSKPLNNQSFASFKGGLAVASDSEIKFFTSMGRMTMTSGSPHTNPDIVTSNSHVLIYDRGSKSYSVYNSFTQMAAGSFADPISTAAMALDGSFAIVTKSESYGSRVHMFNKDLGKESIYSKNSNVVSLDYSFDGKYLAVLSLDVASGQSFVTLDILKNGKNEVHSTAYLYDVMPYKVSFTSNSSAVVVSDSLCAVYDLKGEMKSKYDYPASLSGMTASDGGFALKFSDNSVSQDTRVLLFDAQGNIKADKVLNSRISDIKMDKITLYAVTDGVVYMITSDIMTAEETPRHGEYATLVSHGEGRLSVCTKGAAYIVDFDLISSEIGY